ncbi:MAG: hypothetical protein J6S50_02315 [Oscillospiraceae bacterium]|nr:hypothetical protein [Oscillospiraceae bacterium]
MQDMIINGIPLAEFGGASLNNYIIGQTPMTNSIFQGTNNSQWLSLHSEYGLREIYITIVFKGATLREAKLNRSRFNGQVYDTCEIFIPDDGFWYRCSCLELGDEELVGIGDTSGMIKSQYRFKGIRHDPLETVSAVSGEPFVCKSTAPLTAARIRTYVPADAVLFSLRHTNRQIVSFGNVSPGAFWAVIDGIDNRVTLHGNNWLNNVTWNGGSSPFIMLMPGENIITTAVTPTTDPYGITVEYYPVYI